MGAPLETTATDVKDSVEPTEGAQDTTEAAAEEATAEEATGTPSEDPDKTEA